MELHGSQVSFMKFDPKLEFPFSFKFCILYFASFFFFLLHLLWSNSSRLGYHSQPECAGQKINLATREKIPIPPIYYPPVHIHRSVSASLSSYRNRLTSRNSNILSQNRRPLSADSRFINAKGNSSVKFNLGNVSLGMRRFCADNFHSLK